MIIYILQAKEFETLKQSWFDSVFMFSTEEKAKQFAIERNYRKYKIYPWNSPFSVPALKVVNAELVENNIDGIQLCDLRMERQLG